MMRQILIVSRLGALAGFSLALLACPTAGPTKQACEEDGQCDSGLLCDTAKKVCVEYLSCQLKQSGCSGTCADDADVGDLCATSAECKKGNVCIDGACQAATACAADEFCREADKGAECQKAGCRVASDCNGGQKCVASECVAYTPDTPDSCVLTGGGIFAPEATGIKLKAVAMKNNVVIPYLEPTTIATPGVFFESDGTFSFKAKGVLPGSETATATFAGNVTCTTKLQHTGALGVGESRVVLYEADATDGYKPVTGGAASIKLFGADGKVLATAFAEPTAGSGVYIATNAAAVGAHVYIAGYGAATYYAGTGNAIDVRLPLDKLGVVAGFGGKPVFTDFEKEFTNLAGSKAEISGAFAGGSLPLASLLNFNLDLFAGDTAPKQLGAEVLSPGAGASCAVAPTNGTGNVDLPRALFAGLNSGRIGPNCDGVAVRAFPGRRTSWSVGTKVSIAKASGLVTLASGGALDIGKILAAVIPLFDNFAIGNDTPSTSLFVAKPETDWTGTLSGTTFTGGYREKNATDMQADTRFPFTNITPSRRMKFIANFSNPGITADFYPNAEASEKLNGMVALVAALHPAYGVVPLGFGAGFDNNGDGTLESLSETDKRFETNKIHSRFAGTNKELSDSEVMGVMVATNFTDITREVKPTDPSKVDPNKTYQKSGAIRVKGLISRNTTTGVGWSSTSPTMGNMADTVQGVNFTQTTYSRNPAQQTDNVLALPIMGKVGANAADVVVVRISRDGVSRTWNLVVNPAAIGATALSIPTNGVSGASEIVSDDAGKDVLIFAATALKFNGSAVSITDRLGSKSGKDLGTLAGDLASFALYYQASGR